MKQTGQLGSDESVLELSSSLLLSVSSSMCTILEWLLESLVFPWRLGLLFLSLLDDSETFFMSCLMIGRLPVISEMKCLRRSSSSLSSLRAEIIDILSSASASAPNSSFHSSSLIMEILQAKVRLLQNFPQKVVLDTKKTKLSLIQSNNLLRLLNCNSR